MVAPRRILWVAYRRKPTRPIRMNTPELFSAALGLSSPWHVESVRFDEGASALVMHLDFKRGSRFSCSKCGEEGCAIHDTLTRSWRHLDFFQHTATIHARVPRTKCPNCGVHQVTLPWARPNSGFTLLFEALVVQLAKHMPIKPLAVQMRVDDKQLWRILEHYVNDGVSRIDCSDTKVVGIDETSARKRHDYVTLFYDMEARRLLYITEGKDAETIEDFDQFLWDHDGNGNNVLEVSCDMSPAFMKGIGEHLERAQITFDRFHVAKLLTDAVGEVRKAESKNNAKIKGSMYLWITNPENLTKSQLLRLEDLKKIDSPLVEAYRLKEGLRRLYEQETFADAEGFLRAWVADALSSGIEPIMRAARTISKHAQGILRWQVSRITNGVMEGINSLIQAAKRKARGYRSTRILRIIAYLIAGRLDLRLPT